MKERFSDEHLNAYLDGELADTERMHLLETLRTDRELASRTCQLQKVKEMVQLAYPLPTEPARRAARTHRRRDRFFGPALAASLLFLVGLLGGWYANTQYHATPSLLEIARSTNFNAASEAGKPWRLMLHVSSGNTHRYGVMLSETERLLRTARAEGQPVHIEIVTNGPGLQLLSNRDDPVTRRLQRLAREFDNLELRACERALARYRALKGHDLNLIPEAGTVPSAMSEVIRRQKEGWAYINI